MLECVTTIERSRSSPPAAPAPGRRPAALAGVAAATVGIGVAQVLAGLLGPSSAPLVAVGGVAVDLTPAWLKDAAISAFGVHDKQVLLTGAAVVLAALAAGAGLLARSRPRPATWLILGLGALAATAAATRPDAGALAVAPSVVGAVVTAVVLPRLVAGPGTAGDEGRRQALTAVLAGAGVLAGGAGWLLGGRVRSAEASRRSVQLPPPASPPKQVGGSVEVGVPGVVPFRVPNREFYRIDTALVVPQLSTAGWSLRVHGMVEEEITLGWDELVGAALVERDLTLCCVSNEVGGDLVGNARWLGLPIGPLLERARPAPDADMVLSRSADGFTAGTPLTVLRDGRDALLAIGMNGRPLPVEHGFPVRMVVPGLYGYVSATKWVVDLKVTRFDADQGYWTPRGWSALGPVKTASRIDVPASGAAVRAGRTAVAGVAWAQHRGIEAVEVRVDEGGWRPARLAAVPSADTWRQWVYPWDATPGSHTLRVRATDGTGAVQTGERHEPAPSGATGWHTVTVEVD